MSCSPEHDGCINETIRIQTSEESRRLLGRRNRVSGGAFGVVALIWKDSALRQKRATAHHSD